MADNVTNELLLEHLKAIQAKLVEHDHGFATIGAELLAIKGHMAALVQSDLNRSSDLASLEARIERIEKRLELAD